MATAAGLPSAGASAEVPAGRMTLCAAIAPVGYLGSLPRGFSGCLPPALAPWQYQVRVCVVCLVAGGGRVLLLRSLLSPEPPCPPQTQPGSGPVGPPGCSQPDAVCVRNSQQPELALLAFWPGNHPAPWATCPGTLTLLEQPPAWAPEWRIVPLHWLLAGPSYSLDRPLAGVSEDVLPAHCCSELLGMGPTALCALPQPHPPWPLSPSTGHPNPLASLSPVLYLAHST